MKEKLKEEQRERKLRHRLPYLFLVLSYYNNGNNS